MNKAPITKGRVFKTIETAAEGTKEPQAAGKKAKKMRMQMTFETEVYEYIRASAALKGVTITELTNGIIKEYMRQHPEDLKQVNELKEIFLK